MENINYAILFICLLTIALAAYVLLNVQEKINEHDRYFIKYIKENCPVAYMGLKVNTPVWLNLSNTYNIT